MHVFLAGSSGLVGSRLIRALTDRGDNVTLLTRRAGDLVGRFGPRCSLVEGDPVRAGVWMREVDEADAVVNLTGENLFARRWNPAFKEGMRQSRVESTARIVEALSKKTTRGDGSQRALVNGSAIGYYGPHGDEELTEESLPGSDFLAKMCIDWEAAAQKGAEHGIRTVRVRTGVVLDPNGGALEQMAKPFQMLGIGGPVGSGRQYVSWIHHEDLTGLFLMALDNSQVQGALNGTAPKPATNKELTQALGRVLERPAFLPTPGLALRLVLGEVAGLVTTGQRVLPRKAQSVGYVFRHPDVEGALRNIFG